MEPDPLDSSDAEERKAVSVLQPSELALDRGAAAVEAALLVALAQNARLADAAVLAERNDRHDGALDALAKAPIR